MRESLCQSLQSVDKYYGFLAIGSQKRGRILPVAVKRVKTFRGGDCREDSEERIGLGERERVRS